MQALIELIAGFIALLAAAALSQFGVNVQSTVNHDREVHRVVDCRDAPAAAKVITAATPRC